MEFKVGDVVVLKSGGPHMTVSHLNKVGSVQCVWFNGVEGPTYKDFAAGTLEHVQK